MMLKFFGRLRLTRNEWLLCSLMACVGVGVGYYGAKYYRLKTSICKPCEAAAAASPETVATEPGMGVSNP